ncbi:beta strand repeat-containing protein [Hymenobacter ruber]
MPILYTSFRDLKLLIAALCTGLAILAGSGTALAQTRILFVGNSFTHGYVAPVLNYNAAAIFDENYGLPANSPRHESDGTGPWGGVPGIFKRFTDEAGLAYEVHIEAINGVDLTYHYTNALAVIGRPAGWDKVVLQELSTGPLPTNKGGNPADFFTYTTRLEQAVHSANAAARVYLYETWARADLTYPAGQPYSGQPITAMGTDLHNAYSQLFTQDGHFEAVAPVGDAWQLAMQTGVAMPNPYNPTAGQLDLWSSYFHASKWGSYLSACVLFGQITGADPRSLGTGETAAADLGIAPADAVALQQVAYNQLSATTSPATYSLSVAATGSGTVTKSPDQASYASGTSVSLTATPAAGFAFTGWSGDATGTTNPLTVTMTANKTITATFTAVAPTTYTLTTAITGNGTVVKDPDQATYASGASVSLTATAAAGYTFSGWSGDATGTANPMTVTMTANKNITATFIAVPPATYTLATSTVGTGTVTKSPNQASYASGSSVTLTATAGAGFTFTGWSGDATGSTNPLTVTMTANKAITATFTATGQSVVSYMLVNADSNTDIQVIATGATLNLATLPTRNLNIRATTNPATVGSVVFALRGTQTQNQTETAAPYSLFGDNGAGKYNSWTPAVGSYTLTATPYTAGSGNGTAGTPLSISFSVSNQAAPANYSLTVNTVGSGTVTKNPDQPSYPSGTNVTLTATPAAGFTFTGWSGSATGSTNPLTVAVTANKNITATFTAVAPTTYTLTTATVGTGSVTKNPNAATYASGSSVTLTATAGAGYTFTGWSGDASGTANPMTVTMTANKTITATFTAVAPTTYTLTTATTGSGTVTKNPNQATYSSGTTVSLTATPAAGYQFSGWSGDASGSTNPLTVTMTANKAITATFTATTTGGTGLTFYRALNINGNALVLDGQNWEAATGAANFTVTGTRFANQNVTLNPATDALRASMIRSSVYGPSIDATLRNVPAGTYAVYAYVWEDNSPETFDVRVQGQVVLANYNSGPAGRWSLLGPYTATVTGNGTLVLSTSGGYANLSGVEVWRQNTTSAARTILNSELNSATQPSPSTGISHTPDEARLTGATGSAMPQVYPNPTDDGRLWVALPDDVEGPVAYSLVSVLGAKLASGQLTGTVQPLDFSREITTSGLYYLLLKGRNQRAQIKLVRP